MQASAPRCDGRTVRNGQTVERHGETYTLQSSGASWSLVRCGDVDRFEVRPDDRWGGDAGRVDVGRSELAGDSEWMLGEDVWVSYSVRVTDPAPDPGSWLVVGQLYPRPDPGDGYFSPAVGMLLVGDELRGETHAQPIARTTAPPTGAVRYRVPFPLGVWHRVVLRIRLAPAGGGRLALWLDGVPRIDRAVAAGYQDTRGPYWKYGLYGGGARHGRVVEYAHMEVSSRSLMARASDPLPN